MTQRNILSQEIPALLQHHLHQIAQGSGVALDVSVAWLFEEANDLGSL